jgi:hypothetical protein
MLHEDSRLRMFENRVLNIFSPKRNEVKGKWRRLHNEELHDLPSSKKCYLIRSRRMIGGACST